MQVRTRWQWQFSWPTFAIDPDWHACTTFDRTCGIHEAAVRRDRIRSHPGVRTHEHAVNDRKWLACDLQLVSIKRDSEQFAPSRIDQMTRWRISGARSSFDEDLFLACGERHHADVRIVVRIAVSKTDGKQHRPAGRQERGMSIETLAALLID